MSLNREQNMIEATKDYTYTAAIDTKGHFLFYSLAKPKKSTLSTLPPYTSNVCNLSTVYTCFFLSISRFRCIIGVTKSTVVLHQLQETIRSFEMIVTQSPTLISIMVFDIKMTKTQG